MDSQRPDSRSPSRMWWICFILLLATLLNYACRFALTQNALQVQEAFDTNKEGYGRISGYFGLGFAFGGLLFGVLADVISVRWLYPAVVLLWSAAAVASGLVTDLTALVWCQFLLGLFEAGHWPCSLRTTQRILPPGERTLGNSVLQSGASLGAVFTPLLVVAVYAWDPGAWRLSFFLVGGLGLPWVILWLLSVREADLRHTVLATDEHSTSSPGKVLREGPFLGIFLQRRWWLLLFVVCAINLLWHYIRVWMPDTLEGDHGYSHAFVQYFTSGYYLVTFIGSLATGWLAAHLARTGWNVFRARLAVFLLCGLLSAAAIPTAFLPSGPWLLSALMIVAFGSLGLFPIYYSLNQEISARHQGKVSGSLSFATWGILYLVHPAIGRVVDQSPESRPYLLAAVGLGPLLAYLVLLLFWSGKKEVMPDGTAAGGEAAGGKAGAVSGAGGRG